MQRSEALDTILEVASEQGGYVGTAQAVRLGVPHAAILRLERVGDLQRVRRGVYRMRHANSRWEQDLAAFIFLEQGRLPWETKEGPRAVLSHESAAAFHGLGTIIPELPTFTALRGRAASKAADVEIHGMRLGATDWRWERAEDVTLPVTTPARTIVDLVLTRVEPSYVQRATREALSRKQTTRKELMEAARRRKAKSASIQARVAEMAGEDL